MTVDNIEEVIFRLTYSQHGGSGLSWTRQDVLDCPWAQAIGQCERLAKMRQRESAAMKAANTPKGRKS